MEFVAHSGEFGSRRDANWGWVIGAFVVVLLGVCALGGGVACFVFKSPNSPSGPIHSVSFAHDETTDVADSLFKAGHFEEAKPIYAQIAKDSKAALALRRLGAIELFENDLSAAIPHLRRAVLADPTNKSAPGLLAEAYYRTKDFKDLIALWKTHGLDGKAAALAQLKGSPYEIAHLGGEVALPFSASDPLPVVTLTVNGKSGRFFVDTGASELLLDRKFAASLGVREESGTTGSFAGGKEAQIGYTSVDRLDLGSVALKRVPSQIMDLTAIGSIFSPPIQGCLGTTVLSQFQSTLDYPNHRIVLRPRNSAPPTALEASIPFWMAGDHFMVTWGQLNSAAPTLLFIDTGLAGGGYTGPKSAIEEAGIQFDDSHARTGVGGGGSVSVTPFNIDHLKLWNVERQNVTGMYTGAFPLESMLGFHIGGLISQDFFRPFAVTFDFAKMRIDLSKPTKASQREVN